MDILNLWLEVKTMTIVSGPDEAKIVRMMMMMMMMEHTVIEED